MATSDQSEGRCMTLELKSSSWAVHNIMYIKGERQRGSVTEETDCKYRDSNKGRKKNILGRRKVFIAGQNIHMKKTGIKDRRAAGSAVTEPQ